MNAGDEIPTLSVTPDRYLTVRYAGASGDFDPIHVDDEFARQVGLPGQRHGLWTMAQVARARPRPPADRAQAPERHVSRHGRAQVRDHGDRHRRGRSRTAWRPSTRSPSRTAARSSATPRPVPVEK